MCYSTYKYYRRKVIIYEVDEMRKFLAIILAVLMLGVAVAGCGEDSGINQSSTQSNTQSDTQSQIPNETQKEQIDETIINEPFYKTPADRDAFATNVAEFVANIEKLIDVNLYNRSEFDDDDCVMYSFKTIDYDYKDAKLDYTVTLGNGAMVTLPTTFELLEKKGLSTKSSADDTVRNNSILISYREFKTEKEEKVMFCPVNLTETKDAPLKECDFFAVGFFLNEYSHSTNNIAEYSQANNAPRFKVCGLDPYSTIEDAIKIVGNPIEIQYSHSDNRVTLVFNKKENNNSTLSIEFTASGNYINKLELKYDYTSIKK